MDDAAMTPQQAFAHLWTAFGPHHPLRTKILAARDAANRGDGQAALRGLSHLEPVELRCVQVFCGQKAH